MAAALVLLLRRDGHLHGLAAAAPAPPAPPRAARRPRPDHAPHHAPDTIVVHALLSQR